MVTEVLKPIALRQVSKRNCATLARITTQFSNRRRKSTKGNLRSPDINIIVVGAKGFRYDEKPVESTTHLSLASLMRWVHRQMELPVEFHRTYYRPRVNPLFSLGEEVARGPCDAGSRWSQFVFTLADVAKRQNRGHLCCKVPRSDIEMRLLHSRMASAENVTGVICSVVPESSSAVQTSLIR